MFKDVDVVLAKIIFVSLAFSIAIAISQYFEIPRGSWIAVTVTFVYGAFRSGLTVKRASDRILGTILGLEIIVFLWFILHFNHELLFIYFLVIFTLTGYCQLQRYPYMVICATIGSNLMIDYAQPLHFSIDLYVINRFFCIVIGSLICIITEMVFCALFAHGSIAMLKKASQAKQLQQKIMNLLQHKAVLRQIQPILLLARQQINALELELTNNMLGYAKNSKLQAHIREQISILVKIINHLQIMPMLQSKDEQGMAHIVQLEQLTMQLVENENAI